MIIRDNYLKKLIACKDTEFIKVITGVRRSGKSTILLMFKNYLLDNGVKEDNIIYINFESVIYDDIKTYKDLYKYVKEKIKNKTYLLLDEVQNVNSWEKAINSFKVDFDIDIYITGSNAYLLSSELSTFLSGRYVEIKVYPLSFKEYLVFNNYDKSNLEDKFNEYLKYGGLPAITLIKDNNDLILSYLSDIYNSIVKKDIIDRNNIKDIALLENIIKYLANNIGSSISSNKISDITGSAVTTKESLKSLVNIFEKRMEYVKKLFTEDEKLIFEYSIEKQRPDLYVQNIVKKYDKTFYSLKKSCYLKIYLYFKLDENSYFLKK